MCNEIRQSSIFDHFQAIGPMVKSELIFQIFEFRQMLEIQIKYDHKIFKIS